MLEVKSKKGKEDGDLRKDMSANYCFGRVGQRIDQGKSRVCSAMGGAT